MRHSTSAHTWIECSEPVEASGAQPDSRPGSSYAEASTVKVMPRFQVDDVARIVLAWRKLLNFELDPEQVRRHLEGLRNWQGRWNRRYDAG